MVAGATTYESSVRSWKNMLRGTLGTRRELRLTAAPMKYKVFLHDTSSVWQSSLGTLFKLGINTGRRNDA